MNTVQNINIKNISITGKNDRKTFDQTHLQELSDSIIKHGILQNVVVRTNGKKGHYELIAGERRIKAAQMAGLKEVPCTIKTVNDTEFKEIMLIENLQREDIHPLQEATGFQELIDKKIAIDQIALKVGKSALYVKQRLALLNLSDSGKELFEAYTMKLGHAKILCMFTPDQQDEAIDRVMQGDEGFNYFNHHLDLVAYMNQYILNKLEDAPFDTQDPNLIKKAGACTTCPKQTGANTELFACVTQDAKCMDKSCFSNKIEQSINNQNKKLFKDFNIKKEDCIKVSENYYTYDESLPREKWTEVKEASECTFTTIGLLTDRNLPDRAIIICANKKCTTHFPAQQSSRPSEVPENETLVEGTKRKMKKRRAKQLIEDTHTARQSYLDLAIESKVDTVIPFELTYMISIMISRSNSGYLRDLAKSMGYKPESDFYFGWSTDFIKFLEKKGPQAMIRFLRAAILRENLKPEDKWICSRDAKEDQLLIHGKALNVDYKPILKATCDLRKPTYKQEDDALKTLIKKEKEKAAKVKALIENASSEYPELHKIIKCKNETKRTESLEKLTLEDLSKMTYRLGLKRKKDGDTAYYVKTISDGLKSLLNSDSK